MLKADNKIIKVRGHHLHVPSTFLLELDRIMQADLVKIVDGYDFYCNEICGRGCPNTVTQVGRNFRDYDKAIAEFYGFEIGKTYPIKEFLEMISNVPNEKVSKGAILNAKYNGCA